MLLDEAKNRAIQLNQEKQGEGEENQIPEEEQEANGEIVGLCSIKYFDLQQNHTSNYAFDYNKILDPRGNTGVYLLYMYARIQSIFKKGGYTPESIQELAQAETIALAQKQERDLALTIL